MDQLKGTNSLAVDNFLDDDDDDVEMDNDDNVMSEGMKRLGTDHYFFIGGVTIFGTCMQFF